jgi:hypothetical protein
LINDANAWALDKRIHSAPGSVETLSFTEKKVFTFPNNINEHKIFHFNIKYEQLDTKPVIFCFGSITVLCISWTHDLQLPSRVSYHWAKELIYY